MLNDQRDIMTVGDYIHALGLEVEPNVLLADIRQYGMASILAKMTVPVATVIDNSKKLYQRSKKRRHVLKLARAMSAGQFEPGSSLAIGYVRNGKDFLQSEASLYDGQHRVAAVVESRVPQPFNLVLREFKSAEDLRLAALRTDAHQKRTPRDQGDIMEIDLGPWSNKEDNDGYISALAKLIGWRPIENSAIPVVSEGNVTGDMRNHIAQFFRPAATEYFNTVKYGTRFYDPRVGRKNTGRLEWLRQGPVVAMATAMFYSNPRIAEEFWRTIAFSEELAHTPEKAVWEFIHGREFHDKKEAGTGGNDPKRLALGIKMAWEYKLARSKLNLTHLKQSVYKTFAEGKRTIDNPDGKHNFTIG